MYQSLDGLDCATESGEEKKDAEGKGEHKE
jgi:hypothetical protein